MNSFYKPEAVVEALGEKVLGALGSAVPKTRSDLDRYRKALPEFASTSSARGLANWIHDRVWHHVVEEIQGLRNAFTIIKGPVCEVVVDEKYRIRVKRHNWVGRVSTYPTATALKFLRQPLEQLVIEGLDQVRLIAGYRWDHTRHEIGPAVLSLRDGLNNVLWVIELSESSTDTSSARTIPPTTPVAPQLEFPEMPKVQAETSA